MTVDIDEYVRKVTEEDRKKQQQDEDDLFGILMAERLLEKKRQEILKDHTIVWRHEWIDVTDESFRVPGYWDVMSYIPHLYPVKILTIEPDKEKAVWYTHGSQRLYWVPPKGSSFDLNQLKTNCWYVIQDIEICDRTNTKYKTMWEWLDAVQIPQRDATRPERYLKDWETLPWLKRHQEQYEQSYEYSQAIGRFKTHAKKIKRRK